MFIQSFVLMAGGFIAPIIRKITPRAALLGSLAGVSITFISMRPGAADVHDAGDRHRLLRHHPGQLVRRRALLQRHARRAWSRSRSARVIAWGSTLFGLDYGGMSARER